MKSTNGSQSTRQYFKNINGNRQVHETDIRYFPGGLENKTDDYNEQYRNRILTTSSRQINDF
ncbi:MAG: hypothetical protein ACTH7P_07730 [Streptococcus thermophilus]